MHTWRTSPASHDIDGQAVHARSEVTERDKHHEGQQVYSRAGQA